MTTTDTPALTTTASPKATVARGLAVGVGLALVANIAVFGIGRLGAPLQVVVTGDSTPSDLPLGAVVAASIVPLIAGALGLAVLERIRTDGYRMWRVLVALITVVSLVGPLTMDTDRGSKLALVVMHLATGAAAIAGLEYSRRRRT